VGERSGTTAAGHSHDLTRHPELETREIMPAGMILSITPIHGSWRTTMDTRAIAIAGLVVATLTLGCGQTQLQGPQAQPVEPDVSRPDPPADRLPTPFTAEQIRDEWIEGFQLVMRRQDADGEHLERWRVVEWDSEGVSIESVSIDGLGELITEPTVQRSGWTELRDHASFPADRTTRNRESRQTLLGDFDGWLYTVEDSEQGTMSRFFFADSLPGAPVHFDVVKDGSVLMELEQMERFRPADSEVDQG
jgi:hypothetical protein